MCFDVVRIFLNGAQSQTVTEKHAFSVSAMRIQNSICLENSGFDTEYSCFQVVTAKQIE